MAKNYITHGRTMDYTATSAINSGDPVVVGTVVGIAASSATSGSEVTLYASGVYELPKASGAIAQGARVYLNSSKKISTSSSGATPAGIAWSAAASGDATVHVKLNEWK